MRQMLFAAALLASPVWADEAAVAPLAPRPVVTEIVQPTLEAGRSFVGTVAAKTETQLAFTVQGIVAESDLRVGQVVEKGQRLAHLVTTDFDASLRSADAGVQSAEAQLTQARDAEQRAVELAGRGVGTDTAKQSATNQRVSAEAQLEQAKSQRDRARDRLASTELNAPVDGVILNVLVEQGATLQAGQPIATLAATDGREVRIDLTDLELAGLAPGAAFTVVLQVDPTLTTSAVLGRIAPVAAQATRTREARLVLNNPPQGFRLGALVDVRPVQASSVLTIPTLALLRRQADQASVWVVARPAGQVSLRSVKLGAEANGRVVLLSGLNPGEEVVIRGVNSLTDGQSVGPQVSQ